MVDNGSLKVAIGSDHAGYRLKESLKPTLQELGYQVHDVGTFSEESCDYPDYALEVAETVSAGDAFRGVLICGTGAGMAMVANKVPGVRAAACNELFSAEYVRRHNDANVLTMGARIIDEDSALEILREFMKTGFEGEGEGGVRHNRRLEKLSGVERKYMETC